MKIYKRDDKIICELDFYQHCCNPYDSNEEKELTHNLIGVIEGDDCNISHLIDLSYKDDQQVGAPIIHTCMEKEEFKKLCSDLGLNIYEYPVCAYCGEVIYGSFLWGKKGNMCDECSVKGLK